MFKMLVGSFMLPDATYIVLRINQRDEYVTHRLHKGALSYQRQHHPLDTEMSILTQCEGSDGHYFGSDYAMAMGDFCQRIMDVPRK